MKHDIMLIDGPHHPNAFDCVAVQPRRGDFDVKCPVCKGHGQWNVELHHHFRSKRETCPTCLGEGWLETGGATPVPDIVLGEHGQPMWIIRYIPLDNSEHCVGDRCLIKPQTLS